jgi:hypothetical protein
MWGFIFPRRARALVDPLAGRFWGDLAAGRGLGRVGRLSGAGSLCDQPRRHTRGVTGTAETRQSRYPVSRSIVSPRLNDLRVRVCYLRRDCEVREIPALGVSCHAVLLLKLIYFLHHVSEPGYLRGQHDDPSPRLSPRARCADVRTGAVF